MSNPLRAGIMIAALICGIIVQSATENIVQSATENVAGSKLAMIALAVRVRSDPVARQPTAAREPPVGLEAKNCSPGLSRGGT
jgi:hypothetical protein